MIGHHEAPGRERHELPGQKIRKRIVSQNHEIHAGKERRKERQHPVGYRFMSTVAEPIEARQSASEIDDDQKKRGQCVDAKMGAEPWKPEGQCGGGGLRSTEEGVQGAPK